MTLVDEEGNGKEDTETRGGKEGPDLRVERGQARHERVGAHSPCHRYRGLHSGGLGHGQDLVNLRDLGHKDKIDQGIDDEEDTT